MSAGRPAWLDRVLAEVEREQPAAFEIFAPPVDPERRSAVLMLFGPTGDGGTDVVLTASATEARSEAALTATATTTVSPIVRASAVAAERRALRPMLRAAIRHPPPRRP